MEMDISYPLVILGVGPLARDIYSWLTDAQIRVAAFYSEAEGPTSIFHVPVIRSLDGWRRAFFAAALPDPRDREKAAAKATDKGLRICEPFIHPTSLTGYGVMVSPGSILGPHTVIGAGTSVGDLSIVETGAMIGAETVIGAFCHVGASAAVGAGVLLSRAVSLGLGSVVKDETAIGERAIVGTGAVVTHEIIPECCVVGNPARPLGITKRV